MSYVSSIDSMGLLLFLHQQDFGQCGFLAICGTNDCTAPIAAIMRVISFPLSQRKPRSVCRRVVLAKAGLLHLLYTLQFFQIIFPADSYFTLRILLGVAVFAHAALLTAAFGVANSSLLDDCKTKCYFTLVSSNANISKPPLASF